MVVSELIERFGHGGDVWTAEKVLGVPKEQLLDLSANINPLGPPESVWKAIQDSLAAVTAYPDAKARELRAVLGAKFEQPVERVLVGNGAAEILYGMMRALRPRAVGLMEPCFSEYAEAAEVVGARMLSVVTREEEDFAPRVEELLAACEQVDLFVIGQPNNPNGRVLELETLARMADRLARRGGHLVVDEAFLDFVPGVGSLLEQLAEYPNVLLLRSMTKFYSIPGLRLGFLLAEEALVARVENELAPWGVNALAQAAGIAGLLDAEFERRSLAWLAEERPFLVEGLRRVPGVKVYGGEVNFVLFRCEVPDLQGKLGRQGILIRSCAAYTGLGDGFYRVAVRTRAESERLLGALAAEAEGGA